MFDSFGISWWILTFTWLPVGAFLFLVVNNLPRPENNLYNYSEFSTRKRFSRLSLIWIPAGWLGVAAILALMLAVTMFVAILFLFLERT